MSLWTALVSSPRGSIPQKLRSRIQLLEILFLPSLLLSSAQAQLSPLASHPGEVRRVGALTQADGWFACPTAICFAGAVLGATLEGEALLAGVEECVAHGGQVQGPNVGMGWRLWLLAVVGWVRGKTVLDLGRIGSSGGFSTIPVPTWNIPFLLGPFHVQHPLPKPPL